MRFKCEGCYIPCALVIDDCVGKPVGCPYGILKKGCEWKPDCPTMTISEPQTVGQNYDTVSNPSHYCDGRTIQPWDAIADWGLNFDRGSAVKYIARAGRKNDELEDLKKARAFLDHDIQRLEREN